MSEEDNNKIVQLNPNKALIKGQGKNQYGLTAKQEIFAQSVADGMTLAEAYKTAFNAVNSKDNTIYNNASVLMSSTKITDRVNQLVAEKREVKSHDAARTLLFIKETLYKEATNKQNKANDRLKAIELLGKLSDIGAFKERIETTTNETKTAIEIEKEIRRKLQELGIAS